MKLEGFGKVSSTYYHPLFRKINRKELLDKFNEWLSLSTPNFILSDEEKRVIIELLIIAEAEGGEVSETIIGDLIFAWNTHVSPLQVRLSHATLKNLNIETYTKTITNLIEADSNGYLKQFTKYLSLEMSLAEYRGVEYPEEKAEVPQSMLPTHERRSFFISLVPLNTKWRI